MIEIGSVSVNYYCLIVYVANSPINRKFTDPIFVLGRRGGLI